MNYVVFCWITKNLNTSCNMYIMRRIEQIYVGSKSTTSDYIG